MTGNYPTLLADLETFINAIGGKWTLVIAVGDPKSLDKAQWLLEGGRDFFSVTPQMQNAMLAELMSALWSKLNRRDFAMPETVMVLAAEAARAHILKRFESGGYDMSLRALSPMWVRYKARHSYILDPRIGIAYGTLYRDIRVRAKFSLQRLSA